MPKGPVFSIDHMLNETVEFSEIVSCFNSREQSTSTPPSLE
jgi:hypothetical protein